MKAKQIIGRYIYNLRQNKKLTQQELAEKIGISYQYLSGLENGQKNFTINILESLSEALNMHLPSFIAEAYNHFRENDMPEVNNDFFRQTVPLPPGLKIEALSRAMLKVQYLIAQLNSRLIDIGAGPLRSLVQGNNFSGIISNLLTKTLDEYSLYRDNSEQRYPDLIYIQGAESVGLEVKATKNVGKGGESHNGHSGWHLIACYEFCGVMHNIRFIHMMCADLSGHNENEPDWKYLGSRVNSETGSQRTETYVTNLYGTTKLRDGSVFLDDTAVSFSRWKQKRYGETPAYSIFYKKSKR